MQLDGVFTHRIKCLLFCWYNGFARSSGLNFCTIPNPSNLVFWLPTFGSLYSNMWSTSQPWEVLELYLSVERIGTTSAPWKSTRFCVCVPKPTPVVSANTCILTVHIYMCLFSCVMQFNADVRLIKQKFVFMFECYASLDDNTRVSCYKRSIVTSNTSPI